MLQCRIIKQRQFMKSAKSIKKNALRIFIFCFFAMFAACRSTPHTPAEPDIIAPEIQPTEKEQGEPIVPPANNETQQDLQAIEGLYVATFFTSKTNPNKTLTMGFEFHSDKTARLLIFKNQNEKPTIFNGKWLKTKDEIIILYFERGFPDSEFFKKRTDGNLSILKSNHTEYQGDLHDYMIAVKVK